MGGGVGGGGAQRGTGGGQGTDAGGGPKEDGPQDAGLALGAMVLQADIPLADVLGIDVDGAASDGILRRSHGPLLIGTWWYKSLSGGALRLSCPSPHPKTQPEPTETGIIDRRVSHSTVWRELR